MQNLDKLTYAASGTALAEIETSDRYRFVNGDIVVVGAVKAAFDDFRPDAVMHLTAKSHVDRWICGAAPFITTNVVGTYTLLQAAQNYWSALSNRKADASASCTFQPTRSTAV